MKLINMKKKKNNLKFFSNYKEFFKEIIIVFNETFKLIKE